MNRRIKMFIMGESIIILKIVFSKTYFVSSGSFHYNIINLLLSFLRLIFYKF